MERFEKFRGYKRRQGFIKYQGENSTWARAGLSEYIDYMDEYNIVKAILQPTNDPYMYFPARKTNEYLSEVISKYPDRLLAFADINFNGSYIANLVFKINPPSHTLDG